MLSRNVALDGHGKDETVKIALGDQAELLRLTLLAVKEMRGVGHYSQDGIMVDTCTIGAADHPFETAVRHPRYRDEDGEISSVVVEAYDTEAEALLGHERWVKTMTQGPLPVELVEICNTQALQMYARLDGPLSVKRQG